MKVIIDHSFFIVYFEEPSMCTCYYTIITYYYDVVFVWCPAGMGIWVAIIHDWWFIITTTTYIQLLCNKYHNLLVLTTITYYFNMMRWHNNNMT